MEVAIVGGGITGLSLALNLHKRELACFSLSRCRHGVTAAVNPHRTNPHPPPMAPESRGLGGPWITGRNCKVRSATRGDIALMSHSISIAAEGSGGSYGRKT
jgi:glycine/D-amino acid oxidase-like deaminating enzyme